MKNTTHKILFLIIALLLVSTFKTGRAEKYIQQSNDTKKANEYYKKAIILFSNAKYDSSVYYFIQSAKIFKEVKDWESYIRCFIKIGDNYRVKNEFEKSLNYLNNAEKTANEYLNKDNLIFSEIYHTNGNLYYNKGDYEKSIEFSNKSISLKIKIKGSNDPTLSLTYNTLGNDYLYLGKHYKALEYYKKALDIALSQEKKPESDIAMYYQNIGIIHATIGDFDFATEYFNKSLKIKEKVLSKNDPALAQLYFNLGRISKLTGKYDDAINYYNQVQEIYIHIFDSTHVRIANVYLNKGNIYNDKNDYEKALIYYSNALNIYQEILNHDHPDISKVYNNIGSIYNKKNDYEKALYYYKKSISIKGSAISKTITLRNFAKIYESTGEIDKADHFYNLSIEKAKNKLKKDHYELGHCYLAYGEFCIKNGEKSNGLEYLFNAYEIFKKNFEPKNPNISNSLNKIGNYYFNEKNFSESLKYYQQSIISVVYDFNDTNFYKNPRLQNIILDVDLLEPLVNKARAFYHYYLNISLIDKDLGASLECYELAIELIDKISIYLTKDSKLLLVGKLKGIFIEAINTALVLYEKTGSENYLEIAFTYSEKSKSTILLTALKDMEAMQIGKIPIQLQNNEKNIKHELANYQKLIYEENKKQKPNTSRIDLWEKKLFDLNKQYDILISSVEKKYPEYYKLKYDKNVIGYKEIQNNINKNEALIEYSVFDTLLFCFIITSDDFNVFYKNIDSSFYKNIKNIRKTFSPAIFANHSIDDYKDYINSAYYLYNKLLAPAQNIIHKKKLIVICDDILGYIPFEALISNLPDTNKMNYRDLKYLIKEHCISYSPLATMRFNNYKKLSSLKKLLAFAPTYKNTEDLNKNIYLNSKDIKHHLMPINNVKNEINRINKIFDGDNFYDFEATELNFKSTAKDYDILHFAMHTLIDDENPMFSKLVFTINNDSIEDGFLNTYEIYNLDLNARLAVLSACKTGCGKLHKGEGILSLARGFIYAGVPGIVMTLWEVEDNSGTDIIEGLYKYLHKGKAKDEALTLAKLDYLKKADQLHSHPYFWSAYVIIGDITPLVKNKTIYTLIVVFIIITLIILVFFSKKWRKYLLNLNHIKKE
ncbi:MAG: CHAT domain-containing protein [Bacteroidales bacterium]|nr:CHAT domain-containing protein [Bacteroidales bacterium]